MSEESGDHELRRCAVVESDLWNRLLDLDDFDHTDELCDQLYADSLGHGMNGRFWR